jgi:hypothetical protein
MNQNEWHQWSSLRPRPAYGHGAPRPEFARPPIQEDTLKEAYFRIEMKNFEFKLKENPRGRFLRITEEKGSRRCAIIIPGTGLKDFQKLLAEMLKASETLPPQSPPTDAPPA